MMFNIVRVHGIVGERQNTHPLQDKDCSFIRIIGKA